MFCFIVFSDIKKSHEAAQVWGKNKFSLKDTKRYDDETTPMHTASLSQ